MDKDRVKKLCDVILETSYKETSIINFDMIPQYKYDNESGKWVPHSHALFIQLKLSSNTMYKATDIQSSINGVLGFECCVDFI
jgi:hypothetical protein